MSEAAPQAVVGGSEASGSRTPALPAAPVSPKPEKPSAIAELRTIAESVVKRRQEKAGDRIRSKPRTSHWASSIPVCLRQGVYEWTEWSQKKLHDVRLQLRFDEGNRQEEGVITEFRALARDLGFEVVEEKAPLEPSMTEKFKLVGYIDFKVQGLSRRRFPVEVKSMADWSFDRLEDLSDDEALRYIQEDPFLSRYYRQIQVYLLGHNMEAGLFVLKSLNGRWRLVPVPLDFGAAEGILKSVETMNSHIAAKTLPDRVPYQEGHCDRCAFAHVCLPDVIAAARVSFVDDPEIESKLERREALKASAKEFEKLDEDVKKKFREVPLAAVGRFVVSGKAGERTSYEYPDEVKKQYAKKSPTWTVKVSVPGSDAEK